MTDIERHGALMPQMSIPEAVDRYNTMNGFVASVMQEGKDYAPIPGTDKPTLLKPGAEKLCSLFGLTTRFTITEKVEDWTGEAHGGEAFFYYAYRCQLYRGDHLIAESDGSCNSWEKKYRWRESTRLCPSCGKAAIIKGKQEYGGGWVCFKRKDGCGAKYGDNDPQIVNQTVGRIPNPDVADLVNTIQKMAQKRAFVGTTLIAVNASAYFTQDLEDGGIIEVDPRYVQVVKVAPVRLQAPQDIHIMPGDIRNPDDFFHDVQEAFGYTEKEARAILAEMGRETLTMSIAAELWAILAEHKAGIGEKTAAAVSP
jgi:hypothetical protein